MYNSSPTFSPDGKLVAVHRKVCFRRCGQTRPLELIPDHVSQIHLFDIDIPGGITFKESETLAGGDWQTLIETGAS